MNSQEKQLSEFLFDIFFFKDQVFAIKKSFEFEQPGIRHLESQQLSV